PTGGGSVVAALVPRIHRRSLTWAPARPRQAAGTESESASRGFAARRGLLAGIACSGAESMIRRTLHRALLLGLLALPIAVPAAAADLLLRGEFSGARVVSATESDATGEASAVLADDNDLLVDLVYAGLANGATGAYLHRGAANENGDRVADLGIPADTTAGQLRQVEIALGPEDAERVRAGESYIVITTLAYPDGAIRAQLVPQPIRLQDVDDQPPELEEEED